MQNLINTIINKKALTYLALIVVPFGLYLRSLHYAFSPMDEDWLIVSNTDFLSKWSSVQDAFKTSILDIYYRPLFNISLILDYHSGKLDPFFYHLTNILLHIVCVLTFYKLLLQLTVHKKTSFLLALLFSVHPLLLHAVAWIPGRNDSMLCLFFLASVYFLLKALKENKPFLMIAHFLFFVLAVFTKENAIVMPLLFAYVYFMIKGIDKKLFIYASVWLVLIIGWYMVRSNTVHFALTTGPSFSKSLLLFVSGLLTNIGKLVLPVYQSVSPVANFIPIILGVIVLAASAFLFYRLRTTNKKIATFGLLVFLIMMVIPVWYGATSTLGEQYEHRMYIPLTGFLICVSQLKIDLENKKMFYAIMIFILGFFFKSYLRMDVYKDQRSYLQDGVKDCPRNYVFHFKLGEMFYADKNYPEAIKELSAALEINSSRAQPYNSRANAYTAIGNKEGALRDFDSAIVKSNHLPNIYMNRCVTLLKFNEIDAAMRDLKKLKECCQDIVPQEIENEIIYKWTTKGFSEIAKLLEKQPNNPILYTNRAILYNSIGNKQQAIADMEKACSLDPKNEAFKRRLEMMKGQ